MKTPLRLLLALLGLLNLPAAQADPLGHRIDSSDAQRFAALFAAGRTQAAALQAGYLDGAGEGVRVFTPHRIQTADHLAKAVAAQPKDYAYAIRTCLPLLDGLNAELRAVYLAFAGLLPERKLPRVHVVFGAGNSGGTASPEAQVIGLEVMCSQGTPPERFAQNMRSLFAHETVHSWQPALTQEPKDLLLFAAFNEGVPDLLASWVTGREPSPEREAWARPREAEIWRRFEADRRAWLAGDRSAIGRWFGNAFGPLNGVPEGWPRELGYWVGMQIARAYVAQAADPRAAFNALIERRDPEALLQTSGYAPR
jgi:hypothetical protein